MHDRSSQTEQPTQRRLQKAREEGQFPQAKEFVSALQFLLLLGLAAAGGGGWTTALREESRRIWERAFEGEITAGDLIALTLNGREVGRRTPPPCAREVWIVRQSP